MATYEEAIQNPVSRKRVFVNFDFKFLLYSWETTATADVWVISILDVEVIAVRKDDADISEAASLAAIAVDEFFWDGAEEKLYVRVPAGTVPYTPLYIGTVRFKFNRDGAELSGVPYEARVSDVPSFSSKVGPTFDGKVGLVSAGSLRLNNVDAMMNRTDIEPDGQVSVTEELSTFGGV